jgi:Fe-S cluster assembly iron-binding protein IscA
MALDEPQADDEIIGDNGINFLIEKVLLEKAKPIMVDFINSDQGTGFKLTSSLVLEENACGNSCNC